MKDEINTSTVGEFTRYIFQDSFGEECAISEESHDGDPRLWFGITKIEPKLRIDDKKFIPYDIPKEVLLNSMMCLNQKQAMVLSVLLKKFAITGKLTI